ncbi:hypothetical protein NVV31_13440 [Cytobacillus firmus]|uniref:AbiTii domain-containing protein n=1 Tax=Cytobacillus firmus TaxID=1399 RepID=UPI0021C7CCC6|nr:hypothetical protein [Cytobacillus firmus]MCU1806385.1 hypothetical protein [Cytobacillus firmus]
MRSIVQELQKEAMSSTSNLSDMLRKSLVIARKLKVKDFEDWVNQELNGYKGNLDDIPEYREVKGVLQFFNPYYGWRPVLIPDKKLAENLTTHRIAQPITEIVYLVNSENNDSLILQLPQEMQSDLVKMTTGRPTEFRVRFGTSQANQIIDNVRKIVLEWSIQLEEDGIMGEGFSFTDKEKQAATDQNYTVNNFYGNATGVQIQQHTQNSSQTMISGLDFDKISSFISTLQDNITGIGLPEDSQKVIKSEIDNISTELVSAEPKSNLIKQSLSTIRNVLEGVSGSLIASGLLHELSKIPF